MTIIVLQLAMLIIAFDTWNYESKSNERNREVDAFLQQMRRV